MKNFRVFILAIRPKTLTASICPVLIGTAMALKAGSFDFLTFLCTLLTGLGIQTTTNLANDYFDFKKGTDTEGRIGPVRVMQARLVTEPLMKKWILFNIIFILLTGTVLILKGGLIFSVLIALSILCAILYTAGPFSIAYLGLGELFVLIFFGPVAVAATYYLQVHTLHLPSVLAGIGVGLFSCGIILINNIRDISEDRKHKKMTLAVRIGHKNALRLYAAFLVVAALMPLTLLSYRPLVWLAALTLIPAFFLIREVFAVNFPRDYIPLLAKTSKLLMVYTLIFSFSWMV